MPTLTKVSETLAAITDWIEGTDWRETYSDFSAEFWQTFSMIADDLTIEEVASELENDWDHLHTLVLEDFLSHEWEDGITALEAFLQETDNELDLKTEAYFRTLIGSQMSVYEAITVVPMSHIIFKNLLRQEEPIKVLEKAASTWLLPGIKAAARILLVGGVPTMTGGIVPLSPKAWELVQEIMQEGRKDLKKEQKNLSKEEIESELLYLLPDLTAALFVIQRLEEKSEGSLVDGLDPNELALIELRFPMKANVQLVVSKFKAAKEFMDGPEPRSWNYVPSGRRNGTVHGEVELIEDELVVFVNSKQRAKDITRQIDRLFKKLAGKPTIRERTVGEVKAMVESIPEIASLEERAEIEANIGAAIGKHFFEALDEENSAIGGVPRDLVKSEGGRQKVAEWLRATEAMSENALGTASYFDFGQLWRELGIEDLRS